MLSLRSNQHCFPFHSFDEFTALRSVVVGSVVGANHPDIDISFEHFFRPPCDAAPRRNAIGPIPRLLVDEIEEDIAELVRVLLSHDVEVHRPAYCDSTIPVRTPLWESAQLYSLMPSDTMLVFGDLIIETPSPMRARYFESLAFRTVVEKIVRQGGHLISVPKPTLTATSFALGRDGTVLAEDEALFDAANCVRIGQDIFVDLNRSANRRGFEWITTTLRRFASPNLRVHPMSIGTDHVDVTLVPLCPSVLLVDPLKVNKETLPSEFKTWDKILVDEVMPERD